MASKRRLRRKACQGKVQYHTHDQGVLAARVLSAKNREAYHSYKCEFGEHWHCGHTRKHGSFVMFA